MIFIRLYVIVCTVGKVGYINIIVILMVRDSIENKAGYRQKYTIYVISTRYYVMNIYYPYIYIYILIDII